MNHAAFRLSSPKFPRIREFSDFDREGQGGGKMSLRIFRFSRSGPRMIRPRRIIRAPGTGYLFSAAHLCRYTIPSFVGLYFRRSTRFRLFPFPAEQSWSFSEVPFRRVRAKKRRTETNIFQIQKPFSNRMMHVHYRRVHFHYISL